MDLFEYAKSKTLDRESPLASRLRPSTLDEVVGQEHIVGKDKLLYRAIKADKLTSVIFYGPPGTGKTTLAKVIANTTRANFTQINATVAGKKDMEQVVKETQEQLGMYGRKTILFIDEIHRFNRAQQDALLHAVEDGIVVLIGATTENPFFEVNSALLSRSRLIELHSLSDDNIREILGAALVDDRGLGDAYTLSDEAADAILTLCAGDARAALTTLSLASDVARAQNAHEITREMVEVAMPQHSLPYDKDRDMHYDIISAFIKSMRGSDPDAALYWLARMIDGGEDPKFIARRIFILASEDIGNADPQALLVAEAAFRAAEVIGYPECGINLAQAAVYMALAPKSNASSQAYFNALAEVKKGPARAVPNHLRDRHRPGSEEYGAYLYPHNYPGAYVEQQYLPDGLERGCFFTPSDRGWERYRIDYSTKDFSGL